MEQFTFYELKAIDYALKAKIRDLKKFEYVDLQDEIDEYEELNKKVWKMIMEHIK
jgi:hypothetical protein